MQAATPHASHPCLAEQALAGLPGAVRRRPNTHAQSLSFVLTVDGDPNPPVPLTLHCRHDGVWLWEYAQHRFGQRQYPGVADPYAVWPPAAQLHDSAEAAQAGLLAVVQTVFPQRPGTLHAA